MNDYELAYLYEGLKNNPRKIKDSELIGIPWTLIIGNNYKEKGQIEVIRRSDGDKVFLSKQEIENFEFEQYTP